MSSSIAATALGSLNPDQLSSTLIKQVMALVPDGSTATFTYGAKTNRSEIASPASILSFSPEANAALTRDQIALQVISRDLPNKSVQPHAPATSRTEITEIDASATALPSDHGTSLLDQYRQMSVSDRFYATTNASDMDFGMTADEKAVFDAAFNSRTLDIQDAANVPLLNDKETWTISKTAGGGMGGSGSFSGAYQPPPGKQSVVFGTIFGGDMLITWDTQPTTTEATTIDAPTPTPDQR